MHLFTACRLLYLLQQSSSSLELRTECSVVLGSLAMGTENNIKSLVDCQIIPSLLQGWTAHKKYCIKITTFLSKFQGCTNIHLCFVLAGLLCPDLIFIEACLRCLRTVFISPVTPMQLLYTVGCPTCVVSFILIRSRLFLYITCLINNSSLCTSLSFEYETILNFGSSKIMKNCGYFRSKCTSLKKNQTNQNNLELLKKMFLHPLHLHAMQICEESFKQTHHLLYLGT